MAEQDEVDTRGARAFAGEDTGTAASWIRSLADELDHTRAHWARARQESESLRHALAAVIPPLPGARPDWDETSWRAWAIGARMLLLSAVGETEFARLEEEIGETDVLPTMAHTVARSLVDLQDAVTQVAAFEAALAAAGTERLRAALKAMLPTCDCQQTKREGSTASRGAEPLTDWTTKAFDGGEFSARTDTESIHVDLPGCPPFTIHSLGGLDVREVAAAVDRIRPYVGPRAHPEPMIDMRRLRIATGKARPEDLREVAAEDFVLGHMRAHGWTPTRPN